MSSKICSDGARLVRVHCPTEGLVVTPRLESHARNFLRPVCTYDPNPQHASQALKVTDGQPGQLLLVEEELHGVVAKYSSPWGPRNLPPPPRLTPGQGSTAQDWRMLLC